MNNKKFYFIDVRDKQNRVYLIILACVALLLYLPTVNYLYTNFDDDLILINNKKILEAPIDYINVFTTGAYWDHISQLYRPIQNLSFLFDVGLSEGMNTWMFHLTNIMLFVFVSIITFIVLNKVTGSTKTSFYFSLLYIVHPIFTSTIAWIPSRGDLFLSIFTLISFLYYVKFLETNDIKSLIISWISFLFALFSKETAVVLPVLFFLYYLFFERKNKITLRHYILMLLILVSYFLWNYLRSIATSDYDPNTLIEPFGYMDIFENLLMIPELFGRMLMPYSFNTLPVYGWFSISLGLVIISFLIYVLNKNTKMKEDRLMIIYFTIWSFLLIAPILFLTKNYYQDYLEHRFLLPMLGIWVIFIKLYDKIIKKKKYSIFIVLAVIFTSATLIKANSFKNPQNFYETAIKYNPNSSFAYYSRGNIKKNEGNINGALEDFNMSISLNPRNAVAYNNRAIMKGQINDMQGALQDINQAISLSPDADMYNNRAMIKYILKDYAGAINDYSKVLTFKSKLIITYYNRGLLFSELKQYDKAIKDFKTYITLDNKNANVYYDMGVAYRMQNNMVEALRCFDKAIELNLVFAQAYNNRAYLKLLNKDYTGALQDCDVLISLNPNDTNALLLKEKINTEFKKK